MGIVCISCDLDEIRCYCEIHGHDLPQGEAAHVVYKRALPRVADFLDDLRVPCTFFIVGQDLCERSEGVQILRDFAAKGCEAANHSMNHRYDLTLLDAKDQAAEIYKAAQIIAEVTGRHPSGFRAPGYNMSAGIVDILAEQGYLYDSSVFPCPLYYSARAAAIGMKSLQGRRSKSLVGDPRMLGAPTTPYRIGREGVWSKGTGLAELPITVVTPARLPFIGTLLALTGKLPAELLARAASKHSFVNLELHGIDFVDADGDGVGYLKEFQPDLRIPLVKRRAALKRAVSILLDSGMEPLTLADAATRILI